MKKTTKTDAIGTGGTLDERSFIESLVFIRDNLTDKMTQISEVECLELEQTKLIKEMTSVVKELDKIVRETEADEETSKPKTSNFFETIKKESLLFD